MNRHFLSPLLAATTCAILSSCYTQVHQYVWQKAKVAEGAEWPDSPNNIALFCEGTYIYAKVNQGKMRGQFKGPPFNTILPLHGVGGYAGYAPIKGSASPVYYRLSATDAAKVRKANATGKTHVAIESLCNTPAPLPSTARPLKVKGQTTVSYPKINGESMERADLNKIPYTTDAHKYYAYPLGVLTAVAVDTPLTLASNAVVLGAAAVGAVTITPIAGLYQLCKACTHQKTESPSTTTTH